MAVDGLLSPTPTPQQFSPLPPFPLQLLPDELIVYILHLLLPPRPSTSYPPRHPSSSSYTDLTTSWTSSNRPPWPHPPVPPALYAFALTCRRNNQLATPLLYHAINLHRIVSTNRLASTLERKSSLCPLIRHIHLPNDGLLHGASDRIADRNVWVASLRSILRRCRRLESIFIATRPGGEALQELMSLGSQQEGGLTTLTRVTVSSLSFSFPALGAGLLNAPNLTHLHLIQWIPPTLSERFGAKLYESLKILRLSRIPSSALRLPPMVFQEQSTSTSAQQLFDQSIVTSPQPLLLLLRECIEQFCSLQVVLLEIVDLGDLDMPEALTPWIENQQHGTQQVSGSTATTSTGGFGAPFDQYSAGNPGQLATLDFPADVPLSSEEGQEWAERLEETRCEHRLQYWLQIGQLKSLLTRYSQEVRQSGQGFQQTQTLPIDFRIVAPRTLGWDRNESLIDFHANARACRGGVDNSAFEDPDVFELVNQCPHLGYDYGSDRSGNKVAYWTGALPRPDVPLVRTGNK